jgi:predicted transcriptional regulator
MVKTLELAISKAASLSEAAQELLGRELLERIEIAREIEARRKGVYVMDDEERAAVREGLQQARRGEFVSDDEMEAFWKKIGVL